VKRQVLTLSNFPQAVVADIVIPARITFS